MNGSWTLFTRLTRALLQRPGPSLKWKWPAWPLFSFLAILSLSACSGSSNDATLGLQLVATSNQTLNCQRNTFCPSLSVQLLGSANFGALSVPEQAITFSQCTTNSTPFMILTPSTTTDSTGTASTRVIAPNLSTASDCIRASVSGTSLTRDFNLRVSSPSPSSGPSTPTGFTLTNISTTVSLVWTVSTGDEITYTIWRGTNSGDEIPYVSGLTQTSYTDTNVTSGTTYFYKVQAVNTLGSSNPSAEVSVTPSTGGCNLTRTPFGGGSGASSDPYIICSTTQLANVNDFKSDLTYFQLASSLDLSSVTDSHPLGSYSMIFSGSFDGQNNVISNWTYSPSSISSPSPIGLFPQLAAGIIQNVTLSTFNIRTPASYSGNSIGTLIGAIRNGPTQSSYGQVVNSSATDSSVIAPAGSFVGGLIGAAGLYSRIGGAAYSGSVSGSNTVGGLIGRPSGATITQSHSAGSVTVTSTTGIAGGLAGLHMNGSSLDRSYSSATINATASTTNSLGGLIGFINTSTVSNSYASGDVTAANGVQIGGLIGGSSDIGNSNSVTFCYSSGLVTAPAASTSVGGLIGTFTKATHDPATNATVFFDSTINSALSYAYTYGSTSIPASNLGRSTIEMRTPSTFTRASWSSLIWNLRPGYYPTLR